MIQDEQYTWRVTYKDGSTLDEYDTEAPNGRGFSSVDAARVKLLELVPVAPGRLLMLYDEIRDSNLVFHHLPPPYKVGIPENASPVFFRRHRQELTTEGTIKSTRYCIGWECADYACYLAVSSDGSCLLTSDREAL